LILEATLSDRKFDKAASQSLVASMQWGKLLGTKKQGQKSHATLFPQVAPAISVRARRRFFSETSILHAVLERARASTSPSSA
jgi:hypothetical protein